MSGPVGEHDLCIMMQISPNLAPANLCNGINLYFKENWHAMVKKNHHWKYSGNKFYFISSLLTSLNEVVA